MLSSAKMYMRMFGIFPMSDLPSPFRSCSLLMNFIHIGLTAGCFILYVICLTHFLIVKVKSYSALFISLFFLVVGLMRLLLYFLILWKKSALLVFMNDLEKVIEKSKTECFSFV